MKYLFRYTLKPDFYFHKTVSDILSPEDDELEWAIETILPDLNNHKK